MKLPDIQYGQARSLPKGPGAQAAVGPALQRQRLSQQAIQLAGEVAAEHREYEVTKSTSGYADEMEQFRLQTAGMNYASPEELKAAGLDKYVSVEGRQHIPKSEWYPEALRAKMDQARSRWGEGIRSESDRKTWDEKVSSANNEMLIRETERATRESARHIQQLKLSDAQDAIDAGNFNTAIEVANTIKDPLLRKSTIKKVEQAQAVDYANTLAVTGTPAEIGRARTSLNEQLQGDGPIVLDGKEVSRSTALEISGTLNAAETRRENELIESEENAYFATLRSENKEDIAALRETLAGDGYTGHMDNYRRVQWMNRIDTMLSRGGSLSNEGKAQVATVIDTVKDGTELLQTGADLNVSAVEREIEQLKALPEGALTPTQIREIAEFDQAKEMYPQMVEFRGQSLQQQDAILNTLRATDNPTVQQTNLLAQLEKVNASKRKLLDSDSMLYAQEYEGADINPLMGDNFAEEAKNRVRLNKEVLEGNGYSSGPLTQAEMNDFGAQMDADPNFYIGFIESLQEAVGADARYYVEQLSEVAGPSASVAGEMMVYDRDRNGKQAAITLRKGTQLRAAGEYNIEGENGVKGELNRRFREMYPNDPARASELTEATLDYYVGLQATPYQLQSLAQETPEEIDTNTGRYAIDLNGDALAYAIDRTTGGRSQIDPDGFGDRYHIPAPVRGWDEDKTQAWFDGLQGSDMPDIPRNTVGGGKARLAEMVRDGDVRLEAVPFETGKYYLRDADSNLLLPMADGSRAILEYK